MSINNSRLLPPRTMRVLIAAAAIALCLEGIWTAGKLGYSRLLIVYAKVASNLAAADESTRLSPSDAEAHFVRAELLRTRGDTTSAETEFERAAALRPRDYVLWLELGLTRDQAGDAAGALSAFNEAVQLAPRYAQPLWQRGNLLIRLGRYDEAFRDLRSAAESNPDLIPNLIDLAWGLSKGDLKVAEELAQITTNRMHTAFARLLARQGKAKEAVSQFRAAGSVPEENRRELVEQLIATAAFQEAFEVWRGTGPPETLPAIYDGGFEGPLSLGEAGFGWRVPRNTQGVKMSLDPSQPQSGAQSLCIEFVGDSNPDSSLLSQLIPVASSRRYRIGFAARTRDVVTGGLPLVTVNDATGQHKRLGQSAPLPQGTNNWQMISFELPTATASNAVILSVQRENCTTSPCPIFGSIWLDSFSIEPVNQ